MIESLKCPECSAPLERPVGETRTLHCPYCQSSVLLDRAIAASTQPRPINFVISGADAAPRRRSAWVLWFIAGIAAVVVGFPVVMSLFVFGVHQHVKNTTFTPLSPISTMPAFKLPPQLLPPAAPSFATLLTKFGSKGVAAGQFDDIRSTAVDGVGHIYVGEAFGGRVQVFDAEGKFLKLWTVDPKRLLANLAASRDGTVYVVIAGIVQRFEGLTGKPLGEIKVLNDHGQAVYFNDLCVGVTGDLYALDQESKIWTLNDAAVVQHTLDAKKVTQDDDIALERIAVSGDGRLYAIDHHRGIYQFSIDGKFINRFAMIDEADPAERRPETLHMAVNLAVDGQGRVIVADLNPALKVFDRAGRFLGSFGENEICFGVGVNDAGEIIGCFRNAYEVRKYKLLSK